MDDVLLVNASVKARSRHARLGPPLGLGYIGAVLLENGYSVSAEDCNVTDFRPERMRRIVEARAPRIVGISTNTETYPNGLQIAAIAKQVDPAAIVVMGGAHATVMHREAASEPHVDVVVRGEGEHTMLELADELLRGHGSLARIAGITYRRGGEIHVAPGRGPLADPDRLPMPARDLFPLPLYERPASVLTSRGGCPCDCVFCAVNNVWQGKRRFRTLEHVVREVAFVADTLGYEEISFADDTFTLSRKRVARLCTLLAALQESVPCRWRCTTRVDMVSGPLLRAMRDAGCFSITFGVESASQRILDTLGKKITRGQVMKAVTASLDLGLEVLCSFMFPHPDDTEETVIEQKELMKTLTAMGASVSLALTTPFPGTRYYDRAEEVGIRILTDRWEEFDGKHLVIATKHLSEERLQALLEELIADVGMRASEALPA